MTLRAKLRIGTVVTTGLIAIFIVVIFFLTLSQQRLSQKGQIAEKISETSFQLALLRSEYIAHPAERPKSQWVSMYELQLRLLNETKHLFTGSQEMALFEKIHEASTDSRILFGKLVQNIELHGSETILEELNNQLTLKAQTCVSDGLHLAELSRLEALNAGRVFILVVIVLGLLIACISIMSYVTSMKIADSIHVLGEGTKIIAGGDLTHQLDVRSHDELGNAAQLFNAMAKELQSIHTTLEKKVQERTQEISTILRALDNVALVSMTDVKGNILYANDTLVEVSKYTREELIGKNHRILKSGKQPQTLFIELWKTISSGKVWRGEIMNRAKDGTEYWVDTCIAPIVNAEGRPDRYIAVRFLITEQKNAAREIQKFQEAVEASTDAISITLPNLQYVYVNPMWERITGFTQTEALGQSPQMILSKKIDPLLVHKLFSLSKVKEEEEEVIFHSDLFIHKRKDGSEYNAELSVYPIREEGKVAFYVLTHRDITERKRTDHAKSEFISLASHQLRTPLTEIRWALSSLSREALAKNQHHIVESAHKAAAHMSETIRTMLTISHIETGELHPELTAVRLREVIDSVLKIYEMRQYRKILKVVVACPDRLMLRIDNQLLKEILVNIISNAYKYTPHEGSVHITAEQQKEAIRISIADTGIGIPQSEQHLLFTKFFRASNVVNTKEAGSGIGLYMVYALTALLGGTISYSSKENVGTTFTLTFPSAI